MDERCIANLLRFRKHLKAMVMNNLRQKIRQKKATITEMFLPIYALGILLFMKPLIPNPIFPREDQPGEDKLVFEHIENIKGKTVAVTPNTPEIQIFLESLNEVYHELPQHSNSYQDERTPINFTFFNTEQDLMTAYRKNAQSIHLAIIFETNPHDKDLRYEIRTNPIFELTPSTSELFASPSLCRREFTKAHRVMKSAVSPLHHLMHLTPSDDCPADNYFRSGFIAIQLLIDFTKIKIESKKKNFDYPKMSVKMFPKEAHTGAWIVAFRVGLPFYISTCMSQFITYLLILIVAEKENRIKEGMKIMGVKDSVYWIAWFLVYAAIVLIMSVISTIVLFTIKVFEYSNSFLIFLLMLLYGLTIILLAFIVTAFFDNSRAAGSLGSFAACIPSLFYFIPTFIVSGSGSWLYYIISTINSAGFAIAMDKAMMLDLSGEGVQFHNIWKDPDISFGGSMLMMVFDILLYGCLAYYLDNVVPSCHGTQRSPFFCFKLRFWCPNSNLKEDIEANEIGNGMTSEELNSEDIEPVPDKMRGKCAIRIINLHKTFQTCRKEPVKAINGINLTIYEGQITAILGHNGAGKTTLFNILTGLTSPSEGTAYIFGMDIRKSENMEKIRSMTGVCPQHDILYDLLTPREHLHFFATIRNVPSSSIVYEVEKTLADIDLTEKAESAVKVLSGGQRRKLSVGIAVIGDPKIVILDEPTAGVDPYSRRHLWSLLQSKKQGKVILLTTHFMDEADILADRKAVVSKGKLRCCGSSLFLKNKFGIGYHLTLLLGENGQEESITELILQHLPNAEKARQHGKELSYILPHYAVDSFAHLFLDIENNIHNEQSNLHVKSYGVSMTTLEEVFLLLEKDDDDILEENSPKKSKPQLQPISPFILSSLNGSDDALKRSNLTASDSVESESGISLDLLVNPKSVSKGKRRSLDSDGKSHVIGINFEATRIEPNPRKIFMALVKLRTIRLMRDSFRLLLVMFLAPILVSNLGFSILSMQHFDTTVKPLVLNSGTYGNKIGIALHDTSGAANHLLADVRTEPYDGQFQNLLDVAPNIAALDINSCCDTKKSNYTLLYNDTAQHSLPIVMNVINNALYKHVLGDSMNGSISIKAHPFRILSQPINLNAAANVASIMLGSMILFMPVTLSIDFIHDREIRARNQLRVNGLSSFLYFSSYLLVYTCALLTVFGAVLATTFLHDLPSFNNIPAFFTLSALIALYIPAALLFATCTSFIFKKVESAHSFMFNVFLIIAGIQYSISSVLDAVFIGEQMFLEIHTFFSFISTTYLPFGMVYFVNRVHTKCLVNIDCTSLTFSNYMTSDILVMFIGLIVQILVWSFVLKILDARQYGKNGQFPELPEIGEDIESFESESSAQYGMDGDDDVRLEEDKVNKCLMDPGDKPPVIVLQNLRKEYKDTVDRCCKSKENSEINVAVQKLSLTVEAGEVFGLLGHNGAGKTTTMKIITAEEAPTKGKVEVEGMNTSLNSRDVFKHIGYCPQNDAQWKNVTIREHLELYATIRGVPEDEIQLLVNSYLEGLQMSLHSEKQSQYCSGGTRRKLSFAIATIGNPSIILLDEPSSGMDPRSKRFLWDTILASFKDKTGAILTTHSMEEADALCSRVGIMVNGRLKCIGLTQHLKNLYGGGYSLEIKLNSCEQLTSSLADRHESLKNFVFNLFPMAVVDECFEEKLMFSVPQQGISSLAECFSKLEQAKRDLNIEEYSFSQTTLEKVFLRFSKSVDIRNHQ